ncbi:TPA: ash family protein [Citrobacter youngae]|nr:ash family protein [Citrobacter youngae]
MARFASFLCRPPSCISMAGRAGASQDAPVSSKAGKANLVRFRHP